VGPTSQNYEATYIALLHARGRTSGDKRGRLRREIDRRADPAETPVAEAATPAPPLVAWLVTEREGTISVTRGVVHAATEDAARVAARLQFRFEPVAEFTVSR
jgi:hypothetical protein